jgi:hypothetical protein
MAPTNVTGTSSFATQAAVDGDNIANETGVHGKSADGFGVHGEATGTGRGVVAISDGGYGRGAGVGVAQRRRCSGCEGTPLRPRLLGDPSKSRVSPPGPESLC